MKIKKNGLNLKDTIESGQLFRYIKEEDDSYTIIISDRVINVKETEEHLIVTSNKEKDLRKIIINYFDLKRDYDSINKELLKQDPYMKDIVKLNKGYKILRQSKEEMIVSYIISQNNSVKRISESINLLCKKYGKKVRYNKQKYYLFPSFKKLKKLSYKQYRDCGVGFRDKYVKDTVSFYLKNPEFFQKLNRMSGEKAIEELFKLRGIGVKVASCILLFGYGKFDVFPIDTWVKKNIEENYKDVKSDTKSIKEFAKDKYGKYSGLAIQYMFNAKRNK